MKTTKRAGAEEVSLPLPFLAGLLVVVGHREFATHLPGQGVVDDLVWTLCLLTLPWLTASLGRASATQTLVSARRPHIPSSSLLRMSALATPVVVHVLFYVGCYGDWVERLAPHSHTARALLAVLPLYCAELPRLAAATMAEAVIESGYVARSSPRTSTVYLPAWHDVWPSIRLRFGWPLLALMPVLLFGVGMDLLQLWRPGYVFVAVTAAGMSLAVMGFLLVVGAVLPFWFRVAFSVRAAMPEAVGATLRETASRLGFSPKRLFVLPTGQRAVNAMMVGPLPFGRLLCFTDGLLETLDARSLSGVLAHEVGHARMGHPGLLTLLGFVVPVMLLSPIRLLDNEGGDIALLVTLLAAGSLVVWAGLRSLARRFEHEADISSVQVLGADPCSRALLTVSRLTLPASGSIRSRLLSLHPDEGVRLQTMRRYEIEPAFRARFDRQTARLRQAIAAVVFVSVAVGAWFWTVDWRQERIALRFFTGDFVGARRALDELDEVTPRWRDSLRRVGAQLDAADELQPGLDNWQRVEEALVPVAWDRGEQVLLEDGPAAAYRWLSLAFTVMPEATTAQEAIVAYCKAAAERDPDRMAAAARIVLRLGVPPRLIAVFADYQ